MWKGSSDVERLQPDERLQGVLDRTGCDHNSGHGHGFFERQPEGRYWVRLNVCVSFPQVLANADNHAHVVPEASLRDRSPATADESGGQQAFVFADCFEAFPGEVKLRGRSA